MLFYKPQLQYFFVLLLNMKYPVSHIRSIIYTYFKIKFYTMEPRDQIFKIFKAVQQTEEQIENYRQLLNQQIQFNLADLLAQVNKHQLIITVPLLTEFVRSLEINPTAVESVVRFYNNNSSLNLSFVQFSLMFLSRQNKLLAKMVLQRPSLGAMPNYLQNYARKIILMESKLHQCLIEFRKQYGQHMENLLNNILIDSETNSISQEALTKFCDSQFNPKNLLRYLKCNQDTKLQVSTFKVLFTMTNSNIVAQFLKEHSKPKKHKSRMDDVFVRPEFNDCLQREKSIDVFSFRQIKSIQKHLQRNNGCSQIELTTKIAMYRQFIEKQVEKICQLIAKLISIEKQNECNRVQLALCEDFFPVIFFESFSLDRKNKLIPSVFESYLKQFGYSKKINKIYLFFKRYANKTDGKMSFNNFCHIFDTCSENRQFNQLDKNRKIQKLEQIDVDTKKKFFNLVTNLIQNQYRIQKFKHKFYEASMLNLRDVFSCIDNDEDGYISITDIRVIWGKYFGLRLDEKDAKLFWFRMGYKDSKKMINYEQFVNELWVKTNKKL